MMINHIMCTSKILTDLCFTKEKVKTQNGFVEVVYSVLVAKMCWKNIKKIVWALMVNTIKRNNWVWKLFQTNASSI